MDEQTLLQIQDAKPRLEIRPNAESRGWTSDERTQVAKIQPPATSYLASVSAAAAPGSSKSQRTCLALWCIVRLRLAKRELLPQQNQPTRGLG
jgi:hypothetical protein